MEASVASAFGRVNMHSLREGRDEWDNIQDVLRGTFLVLIDTVGRQQTRMQQMEAQMQVRGGREGQCGGVLTRECGAQEMRKELRDRPAAADFDRVQQVQRALGQDVQTLAGDVQSLTRWAWRACAACRRTHPRVPAVHGQRAERQGGRHVRE